jgi:GNAT superfamily N-acetyltransferase
MPHIVQASSAGQYQQIRELLAEYIAWDSLCSRQLGLHVPSLLAFQYATGIEEIPGPYLPPDGALLLAHDGTAIAGCGAFRKLDADRCELKRLYVRPAFQGKGIGHRLVDVLIANAQQIGYATMCLETTTFMYTAVALYQRLGFSPCAAYYAIPNEFRAITVFMERDIRSAAPHNGRPIID